MPPAPGIKLEAQKNLRAPWNPFQLLFLSGLLFARCGVCGQHLGSKPSLECVGCGLRFAIENAVRYFTISLRSHFQCTGPMCVETITE